MACEAEKYERLKKCWTCPSDKKTKCSQEALGEKPWRGREMGTSIGETPNGDQFKVRKGDWDRD